MDKVISLDRAADFIKDGSTLMIGGFLGVGTPEKLIDVIVKKNCKDLVVIGNDSAFPGRGIGKLVEKRLVKKLIVSHIGTNPETGNLMNRGELDVELVPQGTLAERIRIGGAGIGGFLTPTGLGTSVQEGKQIISSEGQDYIIEKPLKAEVALIKSAIADKMGNVFYKGTARNFNPLMATAADIVIVEAEKIVEPGEIDPNHVVTPGIFVSYIVGGDI